MSDRFDERVEGVVGQIADTARELLDEDEGALTQPARQRVERLETCSARPSTPTRSRASSRRSKRCCATRTVSRADLRRLVGLDGDDSPLAKLKVEMTRELRDQVDAFRSEVQDLSEKIAVAETADDISISRTHKGFDFEDVLHEVVAVPSRRRTATSQRRPATESGADRHKVGDEVVVINRDDAFGQECCFVLEAKKRKLDMRAIHAELDEAHAQPGRHVGDRRVRARTRRRQRCRSTTPTTRRSWCSTPRPATTPPFARLHVGPVGRAPRAGRDRGRRTRPRAGRPPTSPRRSAAANASPRSKKVDTQAKKSIDQAQAHAVGMVDDVRDTLDDLEEPSVSVPVTVFGMVNVLAARATNVYPLDVARARSTTCASARKAS